jgi:hypothetical protein
MTNRNILELLEATLGANQDKAPAPDGSTTSCLFPTQADFEVSYVNVANVAAAMGPGTRNAERRRQPSRRAPNNLACRGRLKGAEMGDIQMPSLQPIPAVPCATLVGLAVTSSSWALRPTRT